MKRLGTIHGYPCEQTLAPTARHNVPWAFQQACLQLRSFPLLSGSTSVEWGFLCTTSTYKPSTRLLRYVCIPFRGTSAHIIFHTIHFLFHFIPLSLSSFCLQGPLTTYRHQRRIPTAIRWPPFCISKVSSPNVNDPVDSSRQEKWTGRPTRTIRARPRQS